MKPGDDGRSAFDPDEGPPKEPNLVMQWWCRDGKPSLWTAVFWPDGTVRVSTSRYLETGPHPVVMGPTRERFKLLSQSDRAELQASIGRLGELCDEAGSALAKRDPGWEHGPSLIVWVAQPGSSRVISARMPGVPMPNDPIEFARITAEICTRLETNSLGLREWARH